MKKENSASHLDKFKQFTNDVITKRDEEVQKRIYASLKRLPGWEHVDTFTTNELLEKIEADKIRIGQRIVGTDETEYTIFKNIGGEDIPIDEFTVKIEFLANRLNLHLK